jgi:hypothetical protein
MFGIFWTIFGKIVGDWPSVLVTAAIEEGED